MGFCLGRASHLHSPVHEVTGAIDGINDPGWTVGEHALGPRGCSLLCNEPVAEQRGPEKMQWGLHSLGSKLLPVLGGRKKQPRAEISWWFLSQTAGPKFGKRHHKLGAGGGWGRCT